MSNFQKNYQIAGYACMALLFGGWLMACLQYANHSIFGTLFLMFVTSPIYAAMATFASIATGLLGGGISSLLHKKTA